MINNQKNNKADFLQSDEWRKFQAEVGRRAFSFENTSIIEHKLPISGNYFYCPRGPILSVATETISNFQFPISNELPNSNDQISNKFKIQNSKFKINFSELIKLAKENNIGWIRIDPRDEKALNLIKNSVDYKILKAPHDMQPKEIFLIDISKSEEELLNNMKSKTRYNVKLAQKSGVFLRSVNKNCHPELVSGSNNVEMLKQVQYDKSYYIEEFLKLTKEMAKRQGIKAHPEEYYRKMIEILPENMLKIYTAEYKGKVIAANLILFFGDTATYLHGASGNEHRNVMAPYLLQWQAILDAKKDGFKFYDFGGVMTQNPKPKTQNPWQGITKFKMGFSSNTQPIVFPGSYDIIINPCKYYAYKFFSLINGIYRKFAK